MRHNANEKVDPLTRIQEEIKEVVRREQEYRQLTSTTTTTTANMSQLVYADDGVEVIDNNSTNVNANMDNNNDKHNNISDDDELSANDNDNDNNNNDNDNNKELELVNGSKPPVGVVAARPAAILATSLLVVPNSNSTNNNNHIDEQHSPSSTPSLASSVNSKEDSLDEHHSDDSGISASSLRQKIAGAKKSGNGDESPPLKPATGGRHGAACEQRYIGPNCYNMTPEPPQQKLLTRTISTPQLNGINAKARQFVAFNAATKGVMQRFIASRGKLQLQHAGIGDHSNGYNGNSNSNYNNNNNNISSSSGNNSSNKMKLNARSTTAFADAGLSGNAGLAASAIGQQNHHQPIIPTVTMSAAAVERDSEGRPLRPGYVPVELKIQRELKDLKTRETELKKIRKIRQSTPDLLDSIDKENLATDDEDDDSEVEHCYGPGQLRTAKSISELCDVNGNNNNNNVSHHNASLSSTPSPELDHSNKYAVRHGSNSFVSGTIVANGGGGASGGMRPAMSLAQLCDLTPEEAPSSHRLIAQWESLIQQNA